MISPQQFGKIIPYIGAIVAGIFLYMSVVAFGLTIGNIAVGILLVFGSLACTIFSRPWCKFGAAAIGLSLLLLLDFLAGLPFLLTGGFIILFWWLR